MMRSDQCTVITVRANSEPGVHWYRLPLGVEFLWIRPIFRIVLDRMNSNLNSDSLWNCNSLDYTVLLADTVEPTTRETKLFRKTWSKTKPSNYHGKKKVKLCFPCPG